jgi:hypothetical protein
VLADLEARGATYVDLRIPSRPAVGGLAATTVTPVAPAGSELATTPETGAVTPESAQSAVPNSESTDTATTPTTATGETTTPTIPETTEQPVDPLTAGAGGGATATP